ncbi:hypothetical protein ACQ4PT_050690 [Festuca glaucescens]
MELLFERQSNMMGSMFEWMQGQQRNNQPAIGSLHEFQRANPLTYDGLGDPLLAEDWLLNMQRCFTMAHTAKADKVTYATFMLRGATPSWWETECELYGGPSSPPSWIEFKRIFRDVYIPYSEMEKMRQKFRELKQGNGTVTTYMREFDRLSRYAREEISDERIKMSKFTHGLSLMIQSKISMIEFRNFRHLVDTATIVESKEVAYQDSLKRKNPSSSQNFTPKPPYPQRQQFFKPQVQQSRSQSSYNSFQQQRNGANNHQTPSQNSQNSGNRSAQSTSSPVIQNPNLKCWNCGQISHPSSLCPSPKKNAPPTRSNALRAKSNGNRGRLNHITTEEAVEAPDVAIVNYPLASSSTK